MMIHPWDAATNEAEWRQWLSQGRNFGQLIAAGGPSRDWPIVVPTHFLLKEPSLLEGSAVLLHLARPNPIWGALEENPRVVLSVIDDYAFVPGYWRAAAGIPSEDGVPTSYYSAVQLACEAVVIDEPAEKAAILTAQLGQLQPEGRHAEAAVGAEPYGRMLSGIRGLRLQIIDVRAKFKYDDHKPLALREEVGVQLAERAAGHDLGAHDQQQRRIAELGERFLPR
jgi:transcriptional regulator